MQPHPHHPQQPQQVQPQPGPGQPQQQQPIVINGVSVDGETDQQLRGMGVQPGRYWYDAACGAWGNEGGPAQGIVQAGLQMGGPLQPTASGGGQGMLTGVFINGRELHPMDVQFLQQIVPVQPGRYWLDATGNCGQEGGPPLVNLFMLAQQKQGGGQAGAWNHATKDHGNGRSYVGGDGQGFTYFMGSDGTSWSSG